MQHQDVPFEKIVETVVKERDPSHSPLISGDAGIGKYPRYR
jgi:hypothetical protein